MALTTPARAPAAATTSSALYDAIHAWSAEHLPASEKPSPETLAEIVNAAGAVHEFLVASVDHTLQSMITSYCEDAEVRPNHTGDPAPFDFADVGELIAFTDRLREEASYLLGSVTTIALLAHEDIASIAAGYIPEPLQCLTEKPLNAAFRRMHGLDEVA